MTQILPGNQNSTANRELSIQITPSGFSFSVSQHGAYLYGSEAKSYDFGTIIGDPALYSSVFVGWNCDSVMLLPESVFEPELAREYLRAANLIEPSTRALYNQTLDPRVTALWSVQSDVMKLLEELIPQAYHFHNLQVDILHTEPESVRVSVVENLANVVVSTRDGLHAAETVAFDSVEDLLYFVSKLNMVDKFARHPLELIAPDCGPYQMLFSRHFAQCTFTSSPNIYHPIVLKCE